MVKRWYIILLDKKTIGINFCNVVKINNDCQSKFFIKGGNHQWKGTIPIFNRIVVVNSLIIKGLSNGPKIDKISKTVANLWIKK